VRGLVGKRPAPEFDAWLQEKGILDGDRPGERFGDPEVIR
jgi:ethanolamine ammonia-lyase large subunit